MDTALSTGNDDERARVGDLPSAGDANPAPVLLPLRPIAGA